MILLVQVSRVIYHMLITYGRRVGKSVLDQEVHLLSVVGVGILVRLARLEVFVNLPFGVYYLLNDLRLGGVIMHDNRSNNSLILS